MPRYGGLEHITLNPVFKDGYVKVYQQSDAHSRMPHVGKKLGLVDRYELLNAL